MYCSNQYFAAVYSKMDPKFFQLKPCIVLKNPNCHTKNEVQYNLDLVTINLATTYDLVAILQKAIFQMAA